MLPSASLQKSNGDVGALRQFHLTFHGIGEVDPSVDESERRYWLDVQTFERVLDRVTEWADARITFDDGNLSDFTLALPRLVTRGVRASFFVVAARIGKQGYLGRREMQEMVAAGMKIGSHGMHHRSWRRLGRRDLKEEIHGAKSLLEDALGTAVTHAACPFGEYGRRALSLLAETGFTRVYTSDRGYAKPDGWLQSRNTVSLVWDIEKVETARHWTWPASLVHRCKIALKTCS